MKFDQGSGYTGTVQGDAAAVSVASWLAANGFEVQFLQRQGGGWRVGVTALRTFDLDLPEHVTLS